MKNILFILIITWVRERIISLETLKNTIKQFLSEYYPLIYFCILWFFIQYLMKAWTGDEFLYADLLNQFSLFDVGKHYYLTWSSRVLWDMLGAVTHHYPLFFFKCANTLVMFLLLKGILLLLKDNSKRMQWLLISFIMLFPYIAFYDCGFSITSLYYIWPAACAVYAILLFYYYKIYKHKIIIILLEILLSLFAGNMEQYFFILIGVQFFFIIYSVIYKEVNICLYAGFIASILMGIFSFTAPGKNARVFMEVANSFPEYEMLSIYQKLNIGFSSTMSETIMKGDATFFLFSLIVFLLAFFICHEKWEKYICSLPLIISALYGPLYNILAGFYPYLYKIKETGFYGISDVTNFDTIRTWLPFFLMVLYWAAVLVSIYVIFESKKELRKGVFLVVVLILGLGSRVALCLSPTVYSSGNRTFYPLWLMVLFTSLNLLKILIPYLKKYYLDFIVYGLSITSTIAFLGVIR